MLENVVDDIYWIGSIVLCWTIILVHYVGMKLFFGFLFHLSTRLTMYLGAQDACTILIKQYYLANKFQLKVFHEKIVDKHDFNYTIRTPDIEHFELTIFECIYNYTYHNIIKILFRLWFIMWFWHFAIHPLYIWVFE